MSPIVSPRRALPLVSLCLALIVGLALWQLWPDAGEVSAPSSASVPVRKEPSASTPPENQPLQPLHPARRTSSNLELDVFPVTDDAIADFTSWSARYLAASPEQRRQLEAEGKRLAETRRPVFQKLIQSDPQLALEMAVPRVVRQDLPPAVVALLETPVSAKGDLNVYMGRPAPGMPVPEDSLTLRYFEAGDVSYVAHVFGKLTNVMSRKGLPLRGVAIDRDLAVAENAVRRLEVGERLPAGTLIEETCPVSGETTTALSSGEAVTELTPTVEVAERFITLCDGSHVSVLEDEFTGYLQASGPGGSGFFYDNFPGTWSRAIGNLRCLYIRVTYPDQMAAPNTEEQAYADMRDNARFFLENSYGKMTQTTTVTPVVTLPYTMSWYKDKDRIPVGGIDGLGLIHSHSRTAALAMGYDASLFDCIIVRINGGPRLEGISWGGGDRVWLTWDGMDVINHEVGHSLGLNHANYWNSLDGTPYGHGENHEYGNPFDVMGGGGGFASHYNTISKRLLGWLPSSYVHEAKTNGIYRVFAYDQPSLEEGKRYALTVPKDNVRQYNLEYHPARGGLLANSALVIYSGTGSNCGHLLDTTQGSPGGKNDGGIMVGRTYSDPEADLHFTVLSQNPTTPPSLDIAFNRGPFPGNVAPTATLAASATSIAAGGSVTFTATATDANGDALAYAWEFSDGQTGPNTATFTRSFPSVAQITAMLTVSDMKGGVARRSVVVNVGAHNQQVVTGVVTAAGVPLQGAVVSGGGKRCVTNSDGSYALAGLTTGSKTLTCVLNGYAFTPQFTNPLNVVAGTNAANWTAVGSTFVTLTKVGDAFEGGAAGRFRLTRTGSTGSALTVLVSRVGGTAVKNTDYTFAPDYTPSGGVFAFTIPAGSASLDIVVAAVNSSGVEDSLAEGPEAITLQLTGGSGYLASGGLQVMQVVDNDTALPLVALSAPDPYATEGGDGATFTLTRSGDTAAALSVAMTWTGSATNGTDYNTLPTNVTIPAGKSTQSVSVAPSNDSSIEGPEELIATVAANPAYLRDPSATAASVVLTDDDTPTVTVSVTDASAAESASGSAMDSGTFQLTRTGNLGAPLTVYYGVSGSALHGTDYAALTGEVVIPAGAASAVVVIAPYDDDIAEPAESATLAIANFNNSYSIGAANQGTVTIADNGDMPLVSVRAGAIGTEGGSNASVIFSAIGSGQASVTVNYTVSGTATSGADFTPMAGSLTIPLTGSRQATLTIPIINDTMAEPTETVVIKIAPSSGYRAYNDSSAEAIIRDNDSGGERVMVSIYNQSPSESGATGTFYLSRVGTTGNLTVNYAMSGTATNGQDYQTLTNSTVIPDGQRGVNLMLVPINDALAEGTETATLTILPGAGYSPDRPAAATFEIADNEVMPITVGFQQTSLAIGETPGALGEFREIAVVLSAASTNPVTVNYVSAGGSATGDDVDWAFVDAANGNALIPSGTLTFAPGVLSQNLRIRIKNDGVTEGVETINLGLRAARFAGLTSGRALMTISVADGAGGPVNNPPTISSPGNRSIASNTSTGPLGFTIGDAETPATSLLVSASSSNLTLVPGSAIVLGGSGTNRTVQVTPAANQAGTATITLIVSDGQTSATSSFVLTVTAPVNTPPSIGTIANRSISTNTSTGPIAFSVGDAESTAGSLAVSAGSSNLTLVPASGIVLGGSGASRTVQVTPAANQAGTATITLTVSDGQASASSSFVLTVSVPVNNAPSISAIANQTIPKNSPTGPLAFTVADAETPAGDLQLSATSSNPAVVLPSQVVFGGSAGSRTVQVTPVANAVGTSTLTIQVSDGQKSASTSFVLTVTEPPVGAAWVSASIGNQSPAGSVQLAGGAFTITGSGADIWNSSDAFQFAHQSLTGDGELIARVGFVANPGGDPWAKLGLMMRETLAPESRNVMTLLSSGNGNSFQYRASTAGGCGFVKAGNRPWIRLVRAGNQFTGYSSDDGVNWIALGTTTIEMPATLYVGLAVTSHRNGYLTTGKFENVSGFNIPAGPAVSQDIGVTNPWGTASLKTGTFTLSGAGWGIVNSSDAFHFNHQLLKGDGELVARVAITNNPGGRLSARIGLMMRESLAANSRNLLVFQSGNGSRFQYRTTTGGSTGINGSGSRPWLRLVRSGNTFTGYSSDDGISWVLLGSRTVALPETLYVGLVISSHRDGFLTTGTFTNVSGFGSLNNPLSSAPGTLLLASPLSAPAAPAYAASAPAPAREIAGPASYLLDGGATPIELLAEAFDRAGLGGLGRWAGLDGNPAGQVVIDDRLTLTFVRASEYLDYEVLAADDGETWTVLETNPGEVGAEVTVYDTVPASLNPRRALRLRVTAP